MKYLGYVLCISIFLFSVPLHMLNAADGNIDSTFATTIGTGFNNYVRDIAIQPDGKIILVGHFTNFNGTVLSRIVRLNSDGTIDPTFVTGSGFTASYARHVELLSNGKMYIGGAFTTYNGSSTPQLVKLNSDGSIDTSFNVGTGFFGSPVISIAEQSTGKVVVGGEFTLYKAVSANYIARINADGSRDTTFNSGGSSFNQRVVTIKKLADDKLIIGGNFTTYNGTSRNRIIRLNSDGTIDSSFNPGTGFDNQVYDIEIQSDGKYIVSGLFTTFNGASANGTVRLNSDGSRDTTFDVGTGFSGGAVDDALIQADGKILVGGFFTSYNGTSSNGLIRLNSDGTVDGTFSVGTGFNNFVLGPSMALYSSTRIILGGLFTTYNGTSASRLAMIETSIAPPATPSVPDVTVFRGPTGRSVISGYETASLNNNATNLCEPYINEDIRPNGSYSPDSVRMLQTFLNTYEKMNLNISGVYDTETQNAVRKYQEKYRDVILAPWNITKSTGIVSLTTKAKINSVMCAQKFGCPYFTEYHRPGSSNSDIQRVKSFLNLINPNIPLDTKSTLYDSSMLKSVSTFQNRYKKTVLEPWGLKKATGYWYKTTRKAAHEIMGCIEK